MKLIIWQVGSWFRFGFSWLALPMHLWSASGLGLVAFSMIMVTAWWTAGLSQHVLSPSTGLHDILGSKSNKWASSSVQAFSKSLLLWSLLPVPSHIQGSVIPPFNGRNNKSTLQRVSIQGRVSFMAIFWQPAHHSCMLKATVGDAWCLGNTPYQLYLNFWSGTWHSLYFFISS